mmetsp:Transcript_7246/g.12247  ORF Transcript_7246/g.12247 Transcript_7246/m.12247 type:complete len:270 (-) Transcript_7246:153-962(-)
MPKRSSARVRGSRWHVSSRRLGRLPLALSSSMWHRASFFAFCSACGRQTQHCRPWHAPTARRAGGAMWFSICLSLCIMAGSQRPRSSASTSLLSRQHRRLTSPSSPPPSPRLCLCSCPRFPTPRLRRAVPTTAMPSPLPGRSLASLRSSMRQWPERPVPTQSQCGALHSSQTPLHSSLRPWQRQSSSPLSPVPSVASLLPCAHISRRAAKPIWLNLSCTCSARNEHMRGYGLRGDGVPSMQARGCALALGGALGDGRGLFAPRHGAIQL